MLILWVVPSLAVAVLLFAFAYGQMRRPNPGPTFGSENVASATAFVITALLGFGISGVAMDPEVVWAAFQSLPVTGQIGLAALPLAALALAPVLMRPAFVRAEGPAGVDILPMPPRDPAKSGDKPAASRRGQRRAA